MRGRLARSSSILFWIAIPCVVHAHTVSISTGELRVDGPTAVYELRIPLYEAASIQNPETALLDHIRFGDGHRTKSSCGPEGGMYVCTASFEFPALIPDRLSVECTFFQVTVPNHIHLLTAEQGKNQDQIVFDQTLPRGELRFRPPSPGEIIFRDLTNGAYRQVTSPASLLFLLGVGLASGSLRRAAGMIAVLIAVEWISPTLAARIPTTFSPQFLESAVALAVAYLAVEILFLPDGGGRWAAVAAAGVFEGVMFAGFPRNYLTGANLIQVAGAAVFTLVALRLKQSWRRPAAALVLVSALVWFAIRLVR
jgi:hypothetical protein